MSRIVPNKLLKTRASIEGTSYRMVSFFHAHPSEISEDGWTVITHEGSKFIVDKLTMSVMAECQCEFLSREGRCRVRRTIHSLCQNGRLVGK